MGWREAKAKKGLFRLTTRVGDMLRTAQELKVSSTTMKKNLAGARRMSTMPMGKLHQF